VSTRYDDRGFVPLFDGKTLAGWHPAPRVYGTEWPGRPLIVDRMRAMGFEPPAHAGHIAFVHDNDALFGEARWGHSAACRWRNIRLKDLSDG
jgi:hypothetical protein